MQLFLREKATQTAIQVDEGRIGAYRTLEPYPHAEVRLKIDPKFAKGDEYELVILLSPATGNEWGEVLCHFHYWERALISKEYESHNRPLAEPAYTYLRVEHIGTDRE